MAQKPLNSKKTLAINKKKNDRKNIKSNDLRKGSKVIAPKKQSLIKQRKLQKFDLRRLCKVLDANALARLGVPTPEEMGYCDIVETVEIGGDRVTVFRQENETTKTATIIIRGATQNHLDDIERAIDGGINIVKAIGRDNRLVPGAGATEMELLKQLVTFEIFPRTIAENSGLDATKVLAKLYSIHYNADIAAGTTTTKITKGSDTTIDDVEGCKDESQDAKNYNRLIGVDIENEEDGGGVYNEN
ncbi:13744_t:CDS:2 [Entrophospora sp. SA101]|nr:13744_t:CDS:2 [Entrophospora sp. SA101]